MDIGQLFWLFFMFSALQPVLRQRLLEASRQRLLARIERHRNSRVILLVHRQETMSFFAKRRVPLNSMCSVKCASPF